MFKKLVDAFKKHCVPEVLPQMSPEAEDMARYHVNYVWVNRDKGAQEDAACSVPLRYLDMAYKNARKYPDAKFTIWFDYALFDDKTNFFIASHQYFTAPKNVQFKNLRDIERYAASEVYDVDRPKDIWARVDLARLLVLQHQLNDTDNKADYQLYSDFDVPDVKLDCGRMYSILHKYGLFIGKTLKHNIVENGYLCFDRQDGKDFLEQRLLPRTTNSAKAGLDGYLPLMKVLQGWMMEQGFWYYNGRVSAPRQEMMGYKVPEDPFYKNHKIN